MAIIEAEAGVQAEVVVAASKGVFFIPGLTSLMMTRTLTWMEDAKDQMQDCKCTCKFNSLVRGAIINLLLTLLKER